MLHFLTFTFRAGGTNTHPPPPPARKQLLAKKAVNVAPIPGETKIWQYVSLMKRISLVDCPGIVYDMGESETETVLKGVVRAEKLPDPTGTRGSRVRQTLRLRMAFISLWAGVKEIFEEEGKEVRFR